MKRNSLLKTMAAVIGAVAVTAMPALARDTDGWHGNHAVQRQPPAGGQHGVVRGVTLANRGDHPLAEIRIRLSGTDSVDFSEADNCGKRLGVGESCVINVRFAPKTAGAKSASLEVSSSGGNQSVALSGTGI